jgi:hypothetical protein
VVATVQLWIATTSAGQCAFFTSCSISDGTPMTQGKEVQTALRLAALYVDTHVFMFGHHATAFLQVVQNVFTRAFAFAEGGFSRRSRKLLSQSNRRQGAHF